MATSDGQSGTPKTSKTSNHPIGVPQLQHALASLQFDQNGRRLSGERSTTDHSFFNTPYQIQADTTAGATTSNGQKLYAKDGTDRLRDAITAVTKLNPVGLGRLTADGKYFPEHEFKRLFTRESVQSALGEEQNATLVEYILDLAKKTFATLLLVHHDSVLPGETMKLLMQNGFTDEHLSGPTEGLLSTTLQLCGDNVCEKSCHHDFPVKPLGPWTTPLFENFTKTRWEFLVPTFDPDVFRYDFENNRLLPFVERVPVKDPENIDQEAKSGIGHFSDVIPVRMLATHQKKFAVREKTIVVALKTLRRLHDKGYDIETEWQREANAHKSLNEQSSHLIYAFAAFSQRTAMPDHSDYHIVLEWADGGNLAKFWEVNGSPQVRHSEVEGSRRRVQDMIKQLYGLTEALHSMHSTNPRTAAHRMPVASAQLPAEVSSITAEVGGSDVPSPPTTNRSQQLQVPIVNVTNVDDDGTDVSVYSAIDSADEDGPAQEPPTQLHLERRETGIGPNGSNWRHGDIKPENILRFKDPNDEAALGTLKIADLGRAQQHDLVTALRQTKETERWRTRWYEPPDLDRYKHKQAQEKISRLFDIWSMGCVIFESVLWLLYGSKAVESFVAGNNMATGQEGVTPYWKRTMPQGVGKPKYEVSKEATRWMNHILQHDPEGNGAIGQLITLVRDRLLKIDLPPTTDSYQPESVKRANASFLKNELSKIIAAAEEKPTLFFSGADRTNILPPPPIASLLVPGGSVRSANHIAYQNKRTLIAQQREYTIHIQGGWKLIHDDDFIATRMDEQSIKPEDPDLCSYCEELDIHAPRISFVVDHIKENAEKQDCELCELVYNTTEKLCIAGRPHLSLARLDTDFVLEGTKQKIFRLCSRSPDASEPQISDSDVPLGVPSLFDALRNVDSFAKLPKAWLNDCNKNHGATCAPRRKTDILPKRLVNIEKPLRPKVVITAELKASALNELKARGYAALSHKWGEMPDNAKTTRQNIEARTKKISLYEMPRTFKDAFTIANALGYQFLWIDSLCILQGKDGDFKAEADTMQTTFSDADCVLAACSAEGAEQGFLRSRDGIQGLKLGDLYFSAVTDDFERDVIQSPLNSRGWVLQERALARRTIFFTDMQMYWECGDSIRCETYTRLKNGKIAFLGDANFPDYTTQSNDQNDERTIGDQITLFMDLFQTYTKLNFRYPEDRPTAIDGLMTRLTESFKTQSLAGLFKTFWGRCLLWRRADRAAPLRRIQPGGDHTRKDAPTWSWMAFEGAISFIDPKGGQSEWQQEDIILPLPSAESASASASWLSTSRRDESVAIIAKKAYEFQDPPEGVRTNASLFYDGGEKPAKALKLAVIIGSDRNVASPSQRLHYVMIIKKIDKSPTGAYERIGAGWLQEMYITRTKSIEARIE